MKKDLNKVASTLNEQILSGLFKQAADDKKSAQERGDAFRRRRNINRGIEVLTPLARITAASVIGGLLGGSKGVALGMGLGAGAEYVGITAGAISGLFAGGRSREGQRDYDKKLQVADWKHWAIPGYGAHQATRRVLRSLDALEDLPEQNA